MDIKKILENSEVPNFENFIRKKEAEKLHFNVSKLKFDIFFDSLNWTPFKKQMVVDWKFLLTISYDWKVWYILWFDEIENWILIKQLQWAKNRISYKVNTSFDSLAFFINFFKINFTWKIGNYNIPNIPQWLENPWIFRNDPFFRYMLFKNILNSF